MIPLITDSKKLMGGVIKRLKKKKKIKWTWKLRIKKNSAKIHRNSEIIMDLKSRLENLEKDYYKE